MSLEFEKHYDVVLTNTDLVSTLVAAASSRVGKTALHLDPLDHYGQEWSALKLLDLIQLGSNPICYGPHNDFKTDTILDNGVQCQEIIHCEPSWHITNVQFDAESFNNLETCRRFIKDFSSTAQDKEIDQFQKHYYPKLLQIKSYKEAENIMNEIRSNLKSLNRFDNSFLLDITPRFLYTLCEMVDILRRSRVSEYLNYRKLSRILTPLVKRDTDNANDFSSESSFRLISVPFTKADVFQSTNLSLIEKRLFMKFSQFILSYKKSPQSFPQYESMSFEKCLSEHKITPKLQDLITCGVLMRSLQELSTKDAIDIIHNCLSAVNKFGSDRPYLLHEYGTEDIVQAFSRNSAVYGGTYCLESRANQFCVDLSTNRCKSIKFIHQGKEYQVELDFIVTNYQLSSMKQKAYKPKMISRAIVCSRESICFDGLTDYNNTSLLYLPTSITGSKFPVYVFEADHSTHTCPDGLHIQYFWCDSNGEPAIDELKPVINMVFASYHNTGKETETKITNKPEWVIYFNQRCDMPEYECQLPTNLFIANPPINELGFDSALNQARNIFQQMFPDEEFFPQTEDPNIKVSDDEEEEVEKMNDEDQNENKIDTIDK